MQLATQRLGELAVPDWIRRHRVHRTANRRRLGRVQVEPREIGDMHPGHPLPTAAQSDLMPRYNKEDQ